MEQALARGRRCLIAALVALGAASGAGRAQNPPSDVGSHVAVIGVATVERDAGPDGLPVGGLSGIDYDPASGDWYMISDDKSEFGPARMLRARVDFDNDRPLSVRLLSVIPLRREDGRTFPPQGTGTEASDAESVRVIPGGKGLIWSSEGDAKDGFGPAVRRAGLDGASLGKLSLPSSFAFDPLGKHGPRPNLSIEGLTFTNRGRKLWLSLEAPLQQDGDLARAATGAVVRFTQLAFPSGRLLRQVAYPVEPIGPFPSGRLADNGVSEILALDSRHLLVIERSGIENDEHDFGFRARVYCALLNHAQDVATLASLRDGKVQPVRKALAIDFSKVPGTRIDNVEGMTLGPRLSNGHGSLVFITDNDFSPRRKTQVIALEVMAPATPKAMAHALCGE